MVSTLNPVDTAIILGGIMASAFFLMGAIPLHFISRKRKITGSQELRDREAFLRRMTWLVTTSFIFWYSLMIFLFLGNLEQPVSQSTPQVLGLATALIEVFVMGTSPVVLVMVAYIWASVYFIRRHLTRDERPL